jgi:hypothetical protein
MIRSESTDQIEGSGKNQAIARRDTDAAERRVIDASEAR